MENMREQLLVKMKLLFLPQRIETSENPISYTKKEVTGIISQQILLIAFHVPGTVLGMG